jgi:hypothetical protein
MFRQTLKIFFVGLAALDISRERLELCVGSMVAKAIGVSHSDAEKLEILRDRIKTAIIETSTKVVQRSEVLESQFHDRLRRQVADLSLDALGDSSEINELRAEIASLRAELVQLRSTSAA